MKIPKDGTIEYIQKSIRIILDNESMTTLGADCVIKGSTIHCFKTNIKDLKKGKVYVFDLGTSLITAVFHSINEDVITIGFRNKEFNDKFIRKEKIQNVYLADRYSCSIEDLDKEKDKLRAKEELKKKNDLDMSCVVNRVGNKKATRLKVA